MTLDPLYLSQFQPKDRLVTSDDEWEAECDEFAWKLEKKPGGHIPHYRLYKKYFPNGRKRVSIDAMRQGVRGETIACNWLGKEPNRDIYIGKGDGGFDLVYKDMKVDVKAIYQWRFPLRISDINLEDHFKGDVFVVVYCNMTDDFRDFTQDYVINGFATREELLAVEPYPTHAWDNAYIHQIYNRDLHELPRSLPELYERYIELKKVAVET